MEDFHILQYSPTEQETLPHNYTHIETHEESVMSYWSSSWGANLVANKGSHMGYICNLGQLIGLVKHTRWVNSVYFQKLLLFSISKILGFVPSYHLTYIGTCWSSFNFSKRQLLSTVRLGRLVWSDRAFMGIYMILVVGYGFCSAGDSSRKTRNLWISLHVAVSGLGCWLDWILVHLWG
jgi:hypothetical protein